MKLQTKQLKKFKSIAGSMTQNKLLPILSYLKFDKGEITKNNLESFMVMNAEFEGSCLIDEKILYSFIESTNAEEIDVAIKDKSVIISHGKEKMISPTEPVINFPISSISEGKEIELSYDVIRAINVASNFTMEGVMPYSQCVFVGKGLIAATTGYIAYTEKVDKELPEIVIEKNAATLIKNFESVLFSQNDRCQFYSNHVFKFGFIKKETKFLDMNPFAIVPDEESVEINKSEIIKFCDTCINSTTGRIVVANIVEDKLSMADGGFGIEYEKPLSVKLPNFTFNPTTMSKMLKSIPDEKVNFIRSKDKNYVTGDSGFVALIMEMQVTS